jgi:cell division protein FtsB
MRHVNDYVIRFECRLLTGGRSLQKRSAEIDELRRKLEQLQREYEEVTNMKTSLEKEINTYRELLEGTNNREGLKQIVDHVLEDARRIEVERLSGGSAGSLSYSGGGTAARTTTISRTFVASSGSGLNATSSSAIGSLISGANRLTSNYSSNGQGSTGSAFSHASPRREYT